MVIYSYPMEMEGKQRSPIVWFSKKEKSTGTFGMYFSFFGPLWVWGVTSVSYFVTHVRGTRIVVTSVIESEVLRS